MNNIDFFRKYQGKDVFILLDDEKYVLNLSEVQSQVCGSEDQGNQVTSTSLIFSSEQDYLIQGTYKLKFGNDYMDIFLVPIAPEKGKSTYQAIFN